MRSESFLSKASSAVVELAKELAAGAPSSGETILVSIVILRYSSHTQLCIACVFDVRFIAVSYK